MWANLSSSTKQFIYNVGQLKAIGSPLHAGPTRNPCQLFIQLANVGFYKCIGKIAHGLSRIHGPYIAELCVTTDLYIRSFTARAPQSFSSRLR